MCLPASARPRGDCRAGRGSGTRPAGPGRRQSRPGRAARARRDRVSGPSRSVALRRAVARGQPGLVQAAVEVGCDIGRTAPDKGFAVIVAVKDAEAAGDTDAALEMIERFLAAAWVYPGPGLHPALRAGFTSNTLPRAGSAGRRTSRLTMAGGAGAGKRCEREARQHPPAAAGLASAVFGAAGGGSCRSRAQPR